MAEVEEARAAVTHLRVLCFVLCGNAQMNTRVQTHGRAA